MARDVTEFLHWASEPKMEERKAMAQPVLFYLIVLTALAYLSYKKVWRNVDHD
jgi:ubiquinol-cytochrome c reductase cytochrome c1 subunit